MNQKVILTDCDGVLLDWEYAFNQWAIRHGYTLTESKSYWIEDRLGISKSEAKKIVRMFNESATVRKIPPLRDAIKYVKKIHEEFGYVFHVISSMTDDQYAQHLRIKNLIELFGPTPFEKFVFLPCGADKDDALKEYANSECIWIEDKIKNADLGISLGLNSILVNHDYNSHYKGNASRINNWKEMYEKLAGGLV